MFWLGKSWFSDPKRSFSEEKVGFSALGLRPHSSQKMFFFTGKGLVFHTKAIFSCGKVGFPVQHHIFLAKVGISLQDQVFPSKECEFHLLPVRVTN